MTIPQAAHLAMSEAELQTRITDLCDWLKLRWFHDTDSRRNNAGFPDLAIVGPGGFLFAELKKQTGRVSPDQRAWITALEAVGIEIHVWRPSDWPAIEQRLKQLARTPTPPTSHRKATAP